MAALCGDIDTRERLVRAAVVDVSWAQEMVEACDELVRADRPQSVAVGLAVAAAIVARGLVPTVADTLLARREDWLNCVDPLAPDRSLAAGALAFLARVALPRDRRVNAVFIWALDVEALCRQAWRRLGQRAPDEVIPRLPNLLARAPDLAGEVGTVFALVHGDRVVDAAKVLAGVDPAVRDVAAAAIEKHLYRIKAVSRWVACREALAGRS